MTISETADVRPDRCPLCGEPNACAMAGDGGSCWCFSTEMAAGVLERLPSDVRGRACVCRSCATGSPEPADETPDLI